MPSLLRAAVLAALLLVMLAVPAPAAQANANVAALQVALRALHHYSGGVDGIMGPQTRRAVRRFQRTHHLQVDGVPGPRTRRALGRHGRPSLGSRVMRRGHRGWDVAALQYMLRRRGFSTTIDGGFGSGTEATVKRFQSARGLSADGLAGSATLSALKRRGSGSSGNSSPPSGSPSGPVRFFRPVNAPMGDGFGPRWGRMHTGIDFPAPSGTRVEAAGAGTTTFAGWNSGGYGNLVIVRHRLGFETWYAHLLNVTSSPGENVSGGTRIGHVGSTGRSTGPHLHFEVRLNGTPVNPLPYLLGSTAKVASSPKRRLECASLKPPPEGARPRSLPDYAQYAFAELPPCRPE
jgi:peptidoglycan hydrolase-like protein with peptidoglycan-binding domain